MDGAEGAGDLHGPAARPRAGSGPAAAVTARPASTAAPRARRRPDSTYAKVARQRRQPLLLHPRQGRLPELRGHARRVRRPLARRLDRDPDRPARRLVGDELRHRDDVQARRLPVHERPVELQRQRRQRPCWERDADNHQGYSTGPLAATVDAAPNAPGVQVVSTATWVGTNDTDTDHSYGAAGGYNLEVKIPLADLPAASARPRHRPPASRRRTRSTRAPGVNITPYDEDNTAAAGTTTLRHIDQSTRLAWSNDTGGVQADPFRWGHAYLPGYTPPAGPVDDAGDAERLAPEPRRRELAADDLPVGAGRRADLGPQVGAGGDSIAIIEPEAGATTAEFDITATGAGSAHFFLWAGDHGAIPVFISTCAMSGDPIQVKDYGLSACAITDGGIPPWSPDMSGRVIRSQVIQVASGTTHVSIPLDAAASAPWRRRARCSSRSRRRPTRCRHSRPGSPRRQ